MEKESIKTAMKRSISNVLETMFFLPMTFTDAVCKEAFLNGETDQIVAAKLEFDGPFCGYCMFFMPKNLAVSMTADFLGTAQEVVSDDQVDGTVLEITNMIAGNTFSLYDPQAVFNVGIPEQVKSSDFQKVFPEFENDLFIVIDLLENLLAFQMVIRS